MAAVGCTCCVWTVQAVRRQFEMPAMYRSHEDGLSVMLSLGVRLPLKYGDVMFHKAWAAAYGLMHFASDWIIQNCQFTKPLLIGNEDRWFVFGTVSMLLIKCAT